MSWCGNCFASLSDTEIETDGEYEYIADSNYICKRVKTPPINPADELGKGEDVISSISRPTSSELPSAPSLPSGKEPAIAKESQVQQVGHAIICSRCPKLVKDIKKSDQAVQIDMKPCPAGKHQREKPAKNKKSSSHPLKSTSSSASVNSPKKDRPAVR
ncbi:Hypothetical protein NTJ_01857 [Nesidiocoris tenuis]|uniref:LIM zinc-binding domain-containing protein n=1 Tax=Nesidiocoris tenuis TaxID=355587 RepID=A0ABN7A9R5_9HEMI|nr:Hypothetical protein NTJ_01857 [Nesidiocoris tenuis]